MDDSSAQRLDPAVAIDTIAAKAETSTERTTTIEILHNHTAQQLRATNNILGTLEP